MRFENDKFQDVAEVYPEIFGNNNLPTGILKDKKGIIYVLTVQKGLLQFENNTWSASAFLQLDTLKQKSPIGLFCHERSFMVTRSGSASPSQRNNFILFENKKRRDTKGTISEA